VVDLSHRIKPRIEIHVTDIHTDFQPFSSRPEKFVHFSTTILRTFFELTKFSSKFSSFFDFDDNSSTIHPPRDMNVAMLKKHKSCTYPRC